MENPTPSSRRRVSAEERSRFLVLFGQSGLTQAEFAQQNGIKTHTLRQWIYKSGGKRSAKTHFGELPVGALMTASWAAEVVLEGGITLRLGASAKLELISILMDNLRRRAC